MPILPCRWRAVALAAALPASLVALTWAGQPGAAAQPNPYFSRFLARVERPLTEYRATRRLEARNDRFKAEGWMEARTWLADGKVGYAITGEGGSGLIRKRVLRAALDAEVEAFASGTSARSGLTPENYTFADEPGAEGGQRRVRITARRKEVTLLNGFLHLAEADADLLRVEGRVTKNPSFWTSRVEVLRSYGRINGVRVPVSFTSTAWIRIAGRSEFTMTYVYESINGTPVEPK